MDPRLSASSGVTDIIQQDTRVVISSPNNDNATQVVLVTSVPEQESMSEIGPVHIETTGTALSMAEVADSTEHLYRSFNNGIPQGSQHLEIVSQVSEPQGVITETMGGTTPELEDPQLETPPESEMAFIDMNQFMDVVYTYKCKFCSFSATAAEEMSSHVLSVHVDCNFRNTEHPIDSASIKGNNEQVGSDIQEVKLSIGDHLYNATISNSKLENLTPDGKTEDILDIPPETTNEQDDLAAALAASVEDPPLEEVDEAIDNQAGPSQQPSESECHEIFMCGQCNLSFTTMELCKDHMAKVHDINVVEAELAELDLAELQTANSEISATMRDPGSKKVSIGTQAMMYRKPGRKRKIPVDALPLEDDIEGDVGVQVKPEDIQAQDDTPEDVPEETSIFSEHFLNEREKAGKRRIKVPRTLDGTFYGSMPKEQTKPVKPRKARDTTPCIKCDILACKAKFKTEASLEHHKTCHNLLDDGSRQKGFVCPHCLFNGAQWAPMRLHLWTKHGFDLDLLKCDQCDFRTDAEHKLEVHTQTHDENQHYSCDTCAKPFTQLSQLLQHNTTKHKQWQADEPVKQIQSFKNRQCHICKRIMANSKCLKIHIEYVHNKVKSYSCDYCGHTAARKHMMQVHMRTHSGERPYKCDLCQFSTSDHNTLRRHRLRHTGEKPYKCQHCPYQCIQAISLKIHMKNKHQDCEGLFYCQQCHYHTVNAQYWAQHQQDHSNGLIEEQVEKKYLPEVHVESIGNAAQDESPVLTFKDVLQDLKLATTNPGQLNAKVNNQSIIQGINSATSIIQGVQEIQAVSGEDLMTLSQPTSGHSNIQYIYLANSQDSAVQNSGIQTAFLIDGVQSLEERVMSDLSSAEPAGRETIQISEPGRSDGTITLTIQPDSTGNPQIVTTNDGAALLMPEGEHLVSQTTDALVHEVIDRVEDDINTHQIQSACI